MSTPGRFFTAGNGRRRIVVVVGAISVVDEAQRTCVYTAPFGTRPAYLVIRVRYRLHKTSDNMVCGWK